MRIHSIKLENIKSYEQVTVEFGDGVNAIVGLNGAGKSTLLEAVGFALFNSLDYAKDAYLREGATAGSVTVTFESSRDGRLYRVVRGLGSKPHWTVFDVELDLRLAGGSVDAHRFLREHLGLSPVSDTEQLFRDAVGVPQGTLTAAFLAIPSARKKIFDPLIQVEEYQRAFSELSEATSLLKDRRAKAELEIVRLQTLTGALPERKAEAERLRAEVAAARAELAAARTSLADASALRTTLDEERRRLQALEAEQAARQATARLWNERAATAANAAREAAAAAAEVAENQPDHDAYLAADKRRVALETRKNQLRAAEMEATRKTSLVDSLRSQITRLQSDWAETAEAESRRGALLPLVAEQKRLEGELETARGQVHQLEAARQILAQAEKNLRAERLRLSTLQAQAAEAPDLRQMVNRTLERMAETQAAHEEAMQRVSELSALGNTIKAQNEELSKVDGGLCPVCEQPLPEPQRSAMVERNNGRLVSLRIEYRDAKETGDRLKSEIATLNEERARAESRVLALPPDESLPQAAEGVAALEAETEKARAQSELLAQSPALAAARASELAALGNPRVQVAEQAALAARRPAIETKLAATQQQLQQEEQALALLAATVATFAGLEDEVAAAAAELKQHASAFQRVLARRETAALAPQRKQESAAAQTEFENALELLAQAERAFGEAAAQYDPTRLIAAADEEQRLSVQVGGLEKQISMQESRARQVESEVAQLLRAQQELADARSRAAQIEDQAAVLAKVRSTIQKAGPQITQAVIAGVSAYASQIFGDLLGDHSCSLRWGEDYGIVLQAEGRDRDFKSLSGGEQMIAALSVRLALLREMSAIDIAFFDEPTAHLDGQRRDLLAGQILAVRGFRQLFVISHDDAFERSTDYVVHVVKENGRSRAIPA